MTEAATPATTPETQSPEAAGALPPPMLTMPAARARFSWLAFFAFLFAVLALVMVGWRTYQDQTENELANYRVESIIRDQGLTLGDLRQQLADLRADDRSGRQQLALLIEQQRVQLEAQQQRILELTSIDRSDWELAEAEYLLQLANQRVLLGGDAHGSMELLSAADGIIRDLDDSGLLPVRAALAQDMAALKAMPTVDIEGTYVALAAAADQAAALSLIRPPEIAEPAAATPSPTVNNTWSDRLGAGLEAAALKLDQLVQIRRRDQPYQPLLAPQYEAALRQQLKLAFEQAQSALLAGNQKLYESSLAKAETWLNTYFTLDEQAARAVVATIAELKEQQIKPQLPDISSSRRALNTFIKSRRALQDDNGNQARVEQTP
ncbi:MAG: uroporphyrinogen-III C-methyltransferase [Spongiibacteraceae bacterium]